MTTNTSFMQSEYTVQPDIFLLNPPETSLSQADPRYSFQKQPQLMQPTEVKNVWSYISTPLICLHGLMLS